MLPNVKKLAAHCTHTHTLALALALTYMSCVCTSWTAAAAEAATYKIYHITHISASTPQPIWMKATRKKRATYNRAARWGSRRMVSFESLTDKVWVRQRGRERKHREENVSLNDWIKVPIICVCTHTTHRLGSRKKDEICAIQIFYAAKFGQSCVQNANALTIQPLRLTGTLNN